MGVNVQVKDIARENDGERQEIVITLTASADEVDASAKSFFDDIAQRDIPGFRKGKAPRSVLEQQVGGHANAMGGVIETLVNEHALKAIDDSGVIFINEPTFNVDGELEEGAPFTFSVSGEVAPMMELTSYDPVSIEMPPEEVTDKDIQIQLDSIRDYYHSLENIDDPDHIAEMGDYVNADITILNDGVPISGLNKARRLFALGEGTMPLSFDEQVVGGKVGDILEFDFDARDAEGNSEYGDGDLHAYVDILGFRKISYPEINDEFAQKIGAMDVEDMKKQIKQNIGMQKEQELPKIKIDRVIDEIIERLDGDVPQYYVDFIRQDVGREFMKSLQDQGTNLQEWLLKNAVDGDDMKDDISREAYRRAAIDCALEAIFDHFNLEVTDEDIDAMFAGDDEGEALRKQWEDAHRMADVKKMIRQQKATDYLTDHADVTIVE